LNEAFYQFSSERALVCAHDSSVRTISITSRRAKIIKLHGDYLFDDLKNTTKETHNLEENMTEKLQEFLKEYGLIIAGYSGSDKSITRNLEDMLDNDLCLKNGLFWCFRAEDTITADALEILQRKNSFYVLTSGFDELMAELYLTLGTDNTPFNSKLASDRASSVIQSYLDNSQLKASASTTIQKHLGALETEKNAFQLSDMMRDLNAENVASSGLTDHDLLVYLEIDQTLKARDPEGALARLHEELDKTPNKEFKEILLRRRFVCSIRLHRINEARSALKEVLELEPENFYVALNDCSLIESRTDRVIYLKNLKDRHPFSAPVLNAYGNELREALEKNDKVPSGSKMEDVIAIFERSLQVNPSLGNEAWSALFGIHAKLVTKAAKNRELLTQMVDKHLAQNAYSHRTTAILVRYCRKFKSLEFKNKPLFEYLQEAYQHHFPRDYPSHIDVLVDACIEFDGHRHLRPVLEHAIQNNEVKHDTGFAMTMIDVYDDVFRDVPGAISYGREFLRTHKSPEIEVMLLRLYLRNIRFDKARELLAGLKGAITHVRWLGLEAEILEHEGHYQDAIDVIEGIPDRRDFAERHTTQLSYLELKMDSPEKAYKRCRDFLDGRAFSLHFESVIINYEYAKKLIGKNVDLKRVSNLADVTENEMLKGVCYSLLKKDTDALNTFRTEAEKRFSNIDLALRWPVISRHEKELRLIRDNLLKAKRALSDLPKA
jgi:tetratricopeptide (TPR) repeat protein